MQSYLLISLLTMDIGFLQSYLLISLLTMDIGFLQSYTSSQKCPGWSGLWFNYNLLQLWPVNKPSFLIFFLVHFWSNILLYTLEPADNVNYLETRNCVYTSLVWNKDGSKVTKVKEGGARLEGPVQRSIIKGDLLRCFTNYVLLIRILLEYNIFCSDIICV